MWLSDGDQPIEGLRVVALQGSKTPGELALVIDGTTLVTGDLVRAHQGGRLNLLPDATMLPLHRRMMDELVLAVRFDRAWLERMVAVHRASVELHGAYAARGDSPTLRPVAKAALPIERRHLDRLRGIR